MTDSEFNHSQSQPVHFLPIGIFPEKLGGTPGYEQKISTNPKSKITGV